MVIQKLLNSFLLPLAVVGFSVPAFSQAHFEFEFVSKSTYRDRLTADTSIKNLLSDRSDFTFLSASRNAYVEIIEEYKEALEQKDFKAALDKAKIILTLIAEKRGQYSEAYSKFLLRAASIAVSADDHQSADVLFREAILSGNIRAFSPYARYLDDDWPGTADPKRITRLMEVDAEFGSIRSMINVGWRYYRTPRSLDFSKAFFWSKKASEIGGEYQAFALNNLATIYDEGLATPKDQLKAIDLYKSAERLGSKWAPGNLGRIYYLGLGVEPNVNLAIDYFQRAQARGDEGTAKFFERVLDLSDKTIFSNPIDVTPIMVKVALEGQDEAFQQLGWLHFDSNKTQAITWFLAGACLSRSSGYRGYSMNLLKVMYPLVIDLDILENARDNLVQFHKSNRSEFSEQSNCKYLND